ncbi:hypothetical protein Tco_0579746, partial [Tanacetum coccineum]
AFETLENPPDLEPSLNKLDELLTPPFIILRPNPTHPVGNCIHKSCNPFQECSRIAECRLKGHQLML